MDDAFRASPSKRLDTIVIPTELDARHPDRWVGDALFLPRTRQKFRVLYHLGLTDAVRAGSDGPVRQGIIPALPNWASKPFRPH